MDGDVWGEDKQINKAELQSSISAVPSPQDDRGLQFEGKTATMDEFGKVTGNRDELHDSQAYPDPYGTSVVEVLKAIDSTPHDTADVSSESSDTEDSPSPDEADEWDDAGSLEISKFLGNMPRNRLLF